MYMYILYMYIYIYIYIYTYIHKHIDTYSIHDINDDILRYSGSSDSFR